ncbi:MAG: protein BatD [Ferruginibacter sp.]|nr:protein BatD [Ferruginibacter sp.]
MAKRWAFIMWFGCCLFLANSIAKSQATFKAVLSPDKIGAQQATQLTFSISGYSNIEHIYPPSFNNVEIVSGPSHLTETNTINGKLNRKFSLRFVIKPRRLGKIRFSAAKAVVDGKTIFSNPVTLFVSENLDEQAYDNGEEDMVLYENEDPLEKIKKNMFLKLKVNTQSVFVGEPVYAEFFLYSRLKSHSRLSKNPSFNGFSVVDVPVLENAEDEPKKIDGKWYHLYPVIKTQLYPLQPGVFPIESVELQNNVEFVYDKSQKSRGSFSLSDKSVKVYSSTMASAPLSITVKPLPEKGRPEDYSGAVGEFKLSGALQSTRMTTDDEGKLQVELSGEGNFQMITPPFVSWPAGIEGFEPRVTDKLDVNEVPVKGKKIFDFVFNVSHPGEYVIPPIVFSYFNPVNQVYEQALTGSFKLIVDKGNREPENIIGDRRKSTTSSINYLVGIIGVVGAVALFFLLRAIRRDYRKEQVEHHMPDVGEVVKLSSVFQHDTFEQSKLMLDDDTGYLFFNTLKNELIFFLKKNFSIPEEIFAVDRLHFYMDKKSIPNDLILEVEKILKEIEWHLYTPADNVADKREIYLRVDLLVNKINMELSKQV